MHLREIYSRLLFSHHWSRHYWITHLNGIPIIDTVCTGTILSGVPTLIIRSTTRVITTRVTLSYICAYCAPRISTKVVFSVTKIWSGKTYKKEHCYFYSALNKHRSDFHAQAQYFSINAFILTPVRRETSAHINEHSI